MARFGETVCLDDGRAEASLQLAQHCGGNCSGTGAHEACAGVRSTVRIGALQQYLMDRGYGGVPGCAMLVERLPEMGSRESRRNDYRTTGCEGGERAANQAMTVEEW